jgi:hypothetical protein
MKKIFYLFGEDAVIEYDNGGIEAVIEASEANEIMYSKFCFEVGFNHPNELLNTFEGWGAWETLTEEEYNRI